MVVVLINILLHVLILLHIEGVDFLLPLLLSLVFGDVVKHLILLLLDWQLLLRILIVFFLLLNHGWDLIFLILSNRSSVDGCRVFSGLCWCDDEWLASCTVGPDRSIKSIGRWQRIRLLDRLWWDLLLRSLFHLCWWLLGFSFLTSRWILIHWRYVTFSLRWCFTVQRVIVNVFLLVDRVIFNTVDLLGSWLLLNWNHAMIIVCNVLGRSLVLLLLDLTHLINNKK